jgi:hypothetical protein
VKLTFNPCSWKQNHIKIFYSWLYQNTDLALIQFSLYRDCTVSALRVCSEGLIWELILRVWSWLFSWVSSFDLSGVNTDYFTKWAEVVLLKEVKASDVVKFFTTHIIYRFGTPQRIISDNETVFKSFKVYALAEQFNIDCIFSSIYNRRVHGLAGPFNKTLINIMKKTVDSNQQD